MDRFRSPKSVFTSEGKAWSEVIQQPDLEGRLHQHEPKLGAFVAKHLKELIATATRVVPEAEAKSNTDAATMYPRNATHLLGVVALHADDALTHDVIVEAMGALKTRTLHHVAAQNIHSVITQNAAHRSLTVLQAAADAAGDPEVFHCLLRQIGAHTVIGDLMLVLLGSELTTEDGAKVIKTWNDHALPLHVAKYAQVALSHAASACYFGFLRSAFGLALQEPAGQFVDQLLELYDGGEDDLSVIVFNAVEASAVSAAEFPNLADGLSAVSALISTLARGVFGESASTERDYHGPISENHAIASVVGQLGRVARFLLSENLNSSFGRQRGSFGLLRMRLLEVFMAVYRLNRKASDDALIAADFFAILFDLAAQYPNHDILLNCVSEVCCDAAARVCDQKALIKHLVRHARLPQHIMKWAQATGASLAAVGQQVGRLVGIHAFAKGEEEAVLGDAVADWNAFLEANFQEVRVWYSAITGDAFSDAGSLALPPVTHLDAHVLSDSADVLTSPNSPSTNRYGGAGGWGVGPSSAAERRSRYQFGPDADDEEDERQEGSRPKDADFDTTGFDAHWLQPERKGLPEEDDDHHGLGGLAPVPAPSSGGHHDDDEVDDVLGGAEEDDAWVEQTIGDLDDATSPQPKHHVRNGTEVVVEEWGTPPKPVEDDDEAQPHQQEPEAAAPAESANGARATTAVDDDDW